MTTLKDTVMPLPCIVFPFVRGGLVRGLPPFHCWVFNPWLLPPLPKEVGSASSSNTYLIPGTLVLFPVGDDL